MAWYIISLSLHMGPHGYILCNYDVSNFGMMAVGRGYEDVNLYIGKLSRYL